MHKEKGVESMIKFEDLKEFHLDVLKELSNIGMGNAATSLAQMLGQKVDIKVPRVSVLPFNEIYTVLGDREALVGGIFFEIEGDLSGEILFLFPTKSIKLLLKLLTGMEEDFPPISEMGQSMLQEIGNILCGSFLNALSEFTSFKIFPTPPAFGMDMAESLLSTILISIGEVEDFALIIETEFIIGEEDFNAFFFFLPNPGSLAKILKAVGVDTSG